MYTSDELSWVLDGSHLRRRSVFSCGRLNYPFKTIETSKTMRKACKTTRKLSQCGSFAVISRKTCLARRQETKRLLFMRSGTKSLVRQGSNLLVLQKEENIKSEQHM